MDETIKVYEQNDGAWTIDTEVVCAPGQDLNQALQARGTGDYLCVGIDGTRAFIQVL